MHFSFSNFYMNSNLLYVLKKANLIEVWENVYCRMHISLQSNTMWNNRNYNLFSKQNVNFENYFRIQSAKNNWYFSLYINT